MSLYGYILLCFWGLLFRMLSVVGGAGAESVGGLSAALAEAERTADVYEQAGTLQPALCLQQKGLLCAAPPLSGMLAARLEPAAALQAAWPLTFPRHAGGWCLVGDADLVCLSFSCSEMLLLMDANNAS